MDINVIRRGRKLQFVATLIIGDRQTRVSIERRLNAGVKTGNESTDAFLDALLSGVDVEACFEAMEDRTDLDPQTELQEVIEAGKQELLVQVRQVLEAVVARGRQAEELLSRLAVGSVTHFEPSQGMGICRLCFSEFEVSVIEGTTLDLCGKHANPGFI